jgi:hypothetical protein
MGISKKELINEVMGVPRAIDVWVNMLVDMNQYVTQHAIESDTEWEEHEGKVGVDGEPIRILKTTSEIPKTLPLIKKWFGVSSNKELLNHEDFKKLPLWNPHVVTEIMIIPDEVFEEFKKSNQYEASFGVDSNNEDLTQIGEHKVLSKVILKLDVVMSVRDAEKGNYDTLIRFAKPTMAHELTHAYQKYRMYTNNVKDGFGKEDVLNSVVGMEKETGGKIGMLTQEWNDLTYLIYLHLSFEINARVTQLYYELKEKGVKTKEDIIKGIKESSLWEMMDLLKNFSSEKFIDNHMDVDPMFNLMINDRQVGSGEEPTEFKSKEDILKFYIKQWDEEIADYAEYTKHVGRPASIMSSVPKRALEDPRVFLKFWEDRFHKKGEQYRRKLLKVGQLLFNDINNNNNKNKVTKDEREN